MQDACFGLVVHELWMEGKVKKIMLNVQETAQTFDLGELLQADSGIFEAISPRGDKYQVVCRPGASIVSLRPTSPEQKRAQWQVRKIAELRPSDNAGQPQ